MSRIVLPKIELQARDDIRFRLPERAVELWDKTLKGPTDGVTIQILAPIYPGDEESFSADDMIAALDGAAKRPLTININSPGGSYFEGVTIFNLLKDYPNRVTVNVLGEAASAASVIAMAGDRIRMYPGSLMMIHSAGGLAIGNKKDMRDLAAVLEKVDNVVASIYAARTGNSRDKVLEMMEAETWMTPEEAVKNRFADEIVKDESKKLPAKAAQASALAASGEKRRVSLVSLSANHNPGASGIQSKLPKGTEMKTIAEQIVDFENKRAANAARMNEIMASAAEKGETLGDTETQEYDGLAADIKTVDAHIVRLKAHEANMVANATPITPAKVDDPAKASQARSGILSVKSNVEPGVKMARYVMAQYRANGNLNDALSIVQNNKRWMDQTPELAKVLMAAVAAGDTTTAGWASELVYAENLANEFVEFLRPQTILGKIPNLRKVPFNIRVGSQTSGSSGFWVGQGKPIPVSKLGTSSLTLGMAKAAGLVAIDEELARSSSPSAELLVRDDLAKSIATFLDVQFVDPNVAAVANVSPASITNGVTPLVPTGTTSAFLRADVQTLFAQYINNNLDPLGAVWIMTPITAMAISNMLNALGQPVFPGIGMNGGKFFDIPVVTSMSANIPGSPDSGNMIILLNAPDVFLADEGQVVISVSNEASIELLDNPTNLSTGATQPTTLVSMFQTSSLAIKGVRWINWGKRRTTAVSYIKESAYVT